MATSLGDFLRAKRDSIRPESIGLPVPVRTRASGLRRSDVATRAGISVEYLTRIEQGRDRNPSPAVLNALADGLSLDPAEREHLRYLAKITGGACPSHREPVLVRREIRPQVLQMLGMLEPGVAMLTNRLGDVLAHTSGFELLFGGTGLLDDPAPNLTRYVFTDRRARETFLDWDRVADEQAFDLWLGPSVESVEWFTADLAPLAGPELTRRLSRHLPPPREPWRLADGRAWHREILELPAADAQQLVTFLPVEEPVESMTLLDRAAAAQLDAALAWPRGLASTLY